MFWPIKNSGEILSELKDIGYQVTSLSTYDFSTMYTTLPHNLIKEKLLDLIERPSIKRMVSYALLVMIRMRFAAHYRGYHLWSCQNYIVPAEFGVQFLPRMKNVPKRTEMHLNDISLTNNEICQSQIQLKQPPISWKICCFFQVFVTRE